MHRLLSAMVDSYLELRHSLTERLDRWQRALLDPRKPFRDWARLLEQRIELRRLLHLCEEQLDAITEWRDDRMSSMSERLRVRFADLIEHIERVKDHARQTEQQAESAVQLYFAATSTRTNEVIRLLTLITAVFMPLNLITGIYGMNFDFIPGLHSPVGFWISLGHHADGRRLPRQLLPVAALALAGGRRPARIASRRPRRTSIVASTASPATKKTPVSRIARRWSPPESHVAGP